VTAPQIIQQIEAAGGVLTLKGDRVRYDVPKDVAPLVEMLRQQRAEVFRVLQERTRLKDCYIHKAQATWWHRADGSQVCGKCHPDPYAVALEKTEQSGPPPMPEGVRLLHWAPQSPPVAITACAIVNDVPQFLRTTLEQLRAALDGENRLAGNWSVRELVDRLEQCGVQVEVTR
jgi:hypothetical protein